MNQRIFLLILTVLWLSGCQSDNNNNETPITGLITDSAMAVSAHPIASQVGVDVLKKGGNAVDAAVAVQFVLAVVYPAAGNIGGGGFMVYRDKSGETNTLDYREMAPLASKERMYQDDSGKVDLELSRSGHLAAGVPGTVDGMVQAHKKYGSLPWQKLVQPAIDLAQKGFPLTKKEATGLNDHREQFMQSNSVTPHFATRHWSEGDTLKLPQLAETLMRIRDHNRAGFYEGKTADFIVAEMNRGNGIITHDDLHNYHSVWRKPIIGKYKDHKIISMPPPSSGGVALMQLFSIIEQYPLEEYGFHSVKSVHYITEAEKRVYADRATHLGDPDFYLVPTTHLLDKEYLKRQAQSIMADEATPSDSISAGNFSLYESEETTHYSIVDAQGNAVAMTTTLNGSYGSMVVVDSAGFLLNNEMDDFSVKPGVPNMYGLVGGKANAIAPMKRMLSSMTPTIVEKEGKLFLVVGSPGGSTIITSVFQTIINVIDYKMNMQEAVNAGRFHHQWQPDVIWVEENTLDEETRRELREMGHDIQERSPIGRVDAILVRPNGKLEGGADPRGDDTANGF